MFFFVFLKTEVLPVVSCCLLGFTGVLPFLGGFTSCLLALD